MRRSHTKRLTCDNISFHRLGTYYLLRCDRRADAQTLSFVIDRGHPFRRSKMVPGAFGPDRWRVVGRDSSLALQVVLPRYQRALLAFSELLIHLSLLQLFFDRHDDARALFGGAILISVDGLDAATLPPARLLSLLLLL